MLVSAFLKKLFGAFVTCVLLFCFMCMCNSSSELSTKVHHNDYRLSLHFLFHLLFVYFFEFFDFNPRISISTLSILFSRSFNYFPLFGLIPSSSRLSSSSLIFLIYSDCLFVQVSRDSNRTLTVLFSCSNAIPFFLLASCWTSTFMIPLKMRPLTKEGSTCCSFLKPLVPICMSGPLQPRQVLFLAGIWACPTAVVDSQPTVPLSSWDFSSYICLFITQKICQYLLICSSWSCEPVSTPHSEGLDFCR